ncbi:DUF2986 domain-containing protein [uncultured Shewanella sp.]|uniref:DUF2986 domain-containing protein n=1 Tax=uncultured Shewanella sp. TaxID=173975 RepID=UPI0026299E9D|nr:DUF2986 domain-containing protein [uncultured Shewanella sp.]
MNRKQKIIKKTAKRAKAKLNKHTPPTIKKYVSKAERAANQALKEASMKVIDEVSSTQTDKAEQ